MSADVRLTSPLPANDEQIRATLIAYCRLSEENIARVEQAMRESRIGFGAAAVSSGVVTQRELDKAWDHLSDQLTGEGVIESALLKQGRNRQVALQHATLVKPGAKLISMHDSSNARSERVRRLRTELLMFDDARKEAAVLALLSPSAAEGRTLIASELAIAFAQLGRRTLLIDADLRRPQVHFLFGAENVWGLAQALASGEAPKLLGVEGVQHLSIITAGSAAPNPLELLSDGRFERMLADLRRQYNFIIIDSPPASQFPDALVVADLAGRALVLSRAAVTAHRDMKETLRRLARTRARVLGAVINHF